MCHFGECYGFNNKKNNDHHAIGILNALYQPPAPEPAFVPTL